MAYDQDDDSEAFSSGASEETSGDSDMDVSEMRQTVTYSFADAIRGICQRYETDDDRSDILDLSTMKVVEDKGTLRSEPTMGLGSFYEHTTDPQYKESRSYQKTVQKLKRKKYSGADTSSSGSGSDIDSAGGRSSGCEEDGTAVRHTAEPTHRKKATATIDRNKLSRKKSLSSENAKVPNRKDRGYQPRPCTGSVLTCTKAFCFACECGKPRN